MEFIARQPIFDLHRNVAGYELLYRDSEDNRCEQSDLDLASRKTMSTAMLMGMDALSGGKSLFINCTEDLLCGRYLTLFPPGSTVIEVLESIEATDAVICACRDLKRAGYKIALDDFTNLPNQAALIEVADIIKVDFRLTAREERCELVQRYGQNGRLMSGRKG